jgi:hypothetical protein
MAGAFCAYGLRSASSSSLSLAEGPDMDFSGFIFAPFNLRCEHLLFVPGLV